MDEQNQTQQPPETNLQPQPEASQPEPAAWNGELTALEKEAWYASLDEPARKTLRSGVETRLKNYEKGVQSKMQTWSAEKKDLESRISRAERASKLYEQLAQGEEDPRVAEADAKLATLQEQLSALTGERDSFKTQLQAREMAELEADAQKVYDAYPDVMADDRALAKFQTLYAAGVDPAEAATMVRALYPDLVEEAPKVPRDIALMSKGDGASGRTEVPAQAMSWRDRLDAAASKAVRLHNAE